MKVCGDDCAADVEHFVACLNSHELHITDPELVLQRIDSFIENVSPPSNLSGSKICMCNMI